MPAHPSHGDRVSSPPWALIIGMVFVVMCALLIMAGVLDAMNERCNQELSPGTVVTNKLRQQFLIVEVHHGGSCYIRVRGPDGHLSWTPPEEFKP